jgi:asparagine synthetase B (glutamine-hydrolysing)
MPEIITLLNNSDTFPVNFTKEQFEYGISPLNDECYTMENVMIKVLFGGKTLNKINPIVTVNDVAIVCDGTIYNHKELYKELNIEPTTDYNYEIIVHLYQRYGIEMALQLLDGTFAFVLVDYRLCNHDGEMDATIYVARDPFGVKPLYLLRPNTKNIITQYNKVDGDIYALGTTQEMLQRMRDKMNEREHPDNDSLLLKGKPVKPFYNIESIQPGTYSVFELKFRALASWRFIKYQIPYHTYDSGYPILNSETLSNQLLNEAVIKRIENYRPTEKKQVNIFLSGNFEGFISASIVCDLEGVNDEIECINTYSIGNSEDPYDVKLVAQYLETNHTEFAISEADYENEKENINSTFLENMDKQTYYKWWLVAKNIAKKSPKSLVLLEVGIDELERNKEDFIYLDYRFKMQKYFKTVCNDELVMISRIFRHHGLEVEFPWLDRNMIHHFITISNIDRMIFNPKGIYGNKLLPTGLFI